MSQNTARDLARGRPHPSAPVRSERLPPDLGERDRRWTRTRVRPTPLAKRALDVVLSATGLAQVYAARDLPHRRKFGYDLLYLEEGTFWLDLKLIARSVWISVTGAWKRVGRS